MNQDTFREIDSEDINKDSFSLEKTTDDNLLNINSIKLQTILKISRVKIFNKELLEDVKLIHKDIERTGYLMELGENREVNKEQIDKISESLSNILITFAAFNQSIDEKISDDERFNLGYTQG
jgi:hypothetical protein